MIGKLLVMFLVFFIVLFGVSYAFENLNHETVRLRASDSLEDNYDDIDYGDVPLFSENLRFNHNNISYYIDRECDYSRKEDMKAAFDIFSSRVGFVSFASADSSEEADIKVTCSEDYLEMGENFFAAGEGGPSKIINTSGFKVIEEGTIILYNSDECDYPIVALHELGHVFGFDHSEDPKNIMYNTSDCDQRMSEDMDEIMRKLYSIEPLADLKIDEVSGFSTGSYLSFNITVINEGLVDVDSVTLTILGDGKEVDVVEMNDVGVGFGRTLRVSNMRIKSGTEVFEFILDDDDLIREISKTNNRVEMVA